MLVVKSVTIDFIRFDLDTLAIKIRQLTIFYHKLEASRDIKKR